MPAPSRNSNGLKEDAIRHLVAYLDVMLLAVDGDASKLQANATDLNKDAGGKKLPDTYLEAVVARHIQQSRTNPRSELLEQFRGWSRHTLPTGALGNITNASRPGTYACSCP